jgi:hypothetical protein
MNYKKFRSSDDSVKRVVYDGMYSWEVGKEWVRLPEFAWKEAFVSGCVTEDMVGRWNSTEENMVQLKAIEDQKEQRIMEVIQQLVNEGDPLKMDQLGKPKLSAINELLVDNTINIATRNKIWKKMQG